MILSSFEGLGVGTVQGDCVAMSRGIVTKGEK